jgi:hypothetical protein
MQGAHRKPDYHALTSQPQTNSLCYRWAKSNLRRDHFSPWLVSRMYYSLTTLPSDRCPPQFESPPTPSTLVRKHRKRLGPEAHATASLCVRLIDHHFEKNCIPDDSKNEAAMKRIRPMPAITSLNQIRVFAWRPKGDGATHSRCSVAAIQ